MRRLIEKFHLRLLWLQEMRVGLQLLEHPAANLNRLVDLVVILDRRGRRLLQLCKLFLKLARSLVPREDLICLYADGLPTLFLRGKLEVFFGRRGNISIGFRVFSGR